MGEASLARMTIIDKLEHLKNKAKACHDQGRDPSVVPLTLKDGIDIMASALVLVTYYDNHHHDVTVSNKERETTGPK